MIGFLVSLILTPVAFVLGLLILAWLIWISLKAIVLAMLRKLGIVPPNP